MTEHMRVERREADDAAPKTKTGQDILLDIEALFTLCLDENPVDGREQYVEIPRGELVRIRAEIAEYLNRALVRR